MYTSISGQNSLRVTDSCALASSEPLRNTKRNNVRAALFAETQPKRAEQRQKKDLSFGIIVGGRLCFFDVYWLCTKNPRYWVSLCNLCGLCVSVVRFWSGFINHRDTENTEVAQRRRLS